MEEKLVSILNEMAEHLNIAQMKKLQEVLLKHLISNPTINMETTNEDYMKLFMDVKRIEGSSYQTIQY